MASGLALLALTACVQGPEDTELDHPSIQGEAEAPVEAEQALGGRYNCGRFDWLSSAPEGCSCEGPNGETTFTGPRGDTLPITCDDRRLQACPSSSGVGCSLLGVQQWPVSEDDPQQVLTHMDIGGHMHDLCCAQHYALPGSWGYGTSCNGCTGGNPDGAPACSGETFAGSSAGMPFRSDAACAVEWSYATNAPFYAGVFWWSPFDTSTRWTPAQVVARNMGDHPYGYMRPDGAGSRRPLYGVGLAPRDRDTGDHRADPGMVVGPWFLSDPWGAHGSAMGMSAAQIGSFCKSGRATLKNDQWICR